MVDNRSQADRILVARLSGAAGRLSRFGALDDAQADAGTAELREIAGGRGDLLAEVAGIRLGWAETKGREYEVQAEAIARLCRAAGADLEALAEWIEVGRCRSGPGAGLRLAGECGPPYGHGQVTGRRHIRTHRAPPPFLRVFSSGARHGCRAGGGEP